MKYGLLLYNGGRNTDFLVVELLEGHIHVIISMANRALDLKVGMV